MIKFTCILTLFLSFAALVKAQDEVPELITDRPDQTEYSVVVPHKSLQIETGFVMENSETDFTNQHSFAFLIFSSMFQPELVFRTVLIISAVLD